MKQKTYRIGQLFRLSGDCADVTDLYMLTQVKSGTVCLTVIKSKNKIDVGNRWTDPIQVADPYNVTENEMNELVKESSKNIIGADNLQYKLVKNIEIIVPPSKNKRKTLTVNQK